jgi:hypothetical protein
MVSKSNGREKAWGMFRDCKGGSDEFSRVEVTRKWFSLARSTMRNCVESSSHAKILANGT